MQIVKMVGIKKAFDEKVILNDFQLTVEENEFLIIMGKSGAGKSTLLNIIGLLEKADEGELYLFGEKNIKPYSRKAEKILKTRIGYLFQNFALLENETVYYNLNMAIENLKISDKKERIAQALQEVGLEGYEDKKVYKCSGGEQQRISIARLLLKPCDLILADEPTGSLDKENKETIFNLLLKLKKMGKTLIVVTHDEDLKCICDRCYELANL